MSDMREHYGWSQDQLLAMDAAFCAAMVAAGHAPVFASSPATTSPFPPPLRGRGREGGIAAATVCTPLSTSPPQGGREQAECAVSPDPADDEHPAAERILLRDLVPAVAHVYQVDAFALIRHGRKGRLPAARNVLMYLAHRFAKISMNEIARRLDNRCHTTILSCVWKIDAQILTDMELQDKVELIKWKASEAAARRQVQLAKLRTYAVGGRVDGS